MKYLLPLFLLLTCVGCKKKDSPAQQEPQLIDYIMTWADTVSYIGQYTSRETVNDPAYPTYNKDTSFLDTMFVLFSSNPELHGKIYAYTIFHTRTPFPQPGIPGRDSLEFTFPKELKLTPTPLQLSGSPAFEGSIRFSTNFDSVYFKDVLQSGTAGYVHDVTFTGKR